MIRAICIFFTVIAVAWFNASLMIANQGFLIRERVSADGWSRDCTYYKPVKIVTVTRPIQFPCGRYRDV